MRIGFVYYGYHDAGQLANAASRKRLMSLAGLFAATGAQCHVIGLTKGSPGVEDFAGLILHKINPPASRHRDVFALGVRYAQVVAQLRLDAVCYVSAFSRVILPVRAELARQRQRPAEVVIANDWYTRGTTRTVDWVDSELAWRWLYPQMRNVLAISSAFIGYFERAGATNLLRIPSIFDVKGIKPDLTTTFGSGPITFSYAGNLKFEGGRVFQKDLVANFQLSTTLLTKAQRERIRLQIIGTSQADYRSTLSKLFPDMDPSAGCAVEHVGFLNGEELHERIRHAHFSILFRPDLPYAKYGFATKFTESMALGLPVFANLTGDMGRYLTDGVEGVVARDASPEAIAAALARLLDTDPDSHIAMRRAARAQAERSFDTDGYRGAVADFVARIVR